MRGQEHARIGRVLQHTLLSSSLPTQAVSFYVVRGQGPGTHHQAATRPSVKPSLDTSRGDTEAILLLRPSRIYRKGTTFPLLSHVSPQTHSFILARPGAIAKEQINAGRFVYAEMPGLIICDNEQSTVLKHEINVSSLFYFLSR